jgi:hypothetical protein
VDASLYGADVRIEEIRALLYRVAVAGIRDPLAAPVVDALARAYVAAAVRARVDPPYVVAVYPSAADAVDGYRRAYADASRAAGGMPDLHNDADWTPWPASLPLRDGLPRSLVATVARAAAQRRLEVPAGF